MIFRSIIIIGAFASFVCALPLHAQEGAKPASSPTSGDAIDRFVPRPSGKETKFEYSFLDTALEYMVLRMWPSTRSGSSHPNSIIGSTIGSRLNWGHTSRYRLEGNRIVFSMLDEKDITPLTEYRQDLERLGSEIDIASLPRNEQLVYWMNLHNVAIIEQIAINYPVKSPSLPKFGPEQTPLDQAKVVTVDGIALSPHDIRTRIVYPNWNDPDVIYGFFRGDIGGPSIQRRAYTGENVAELLGSSARDFVNSLRGVESFGKNISVSKIYEEAAPFYFPGMDEDLRAHLAEHAAPEVSSLLARGGEFEINTYEDTVADLAGGEKESSYSYVELGGMPQSTRISPSIARLLGQRQQKLERLLRDGELRGRVIVLPPTTGEEATAEETAPEVE